MERKLRYLEREIRRDAIPVLDTGDNPEAPMPREMIDLEVRIVRGMWGGWESGLYHPCGVWVILPIWGLGCMGCIAHMGFE